MGRIWQHISVWLILFTFLLISPCLAQSPQHWQGDSFTYLPKTYAQLSAMSVVNGRSMYCQDCQTSVPCISGGRGAWVFGIGGAWACNSGGNITNTQFTGSFSGLFNFVGSQVAPTPSTINNACVNGRCSVTAFGASGMGNTILTGTIAAGSNSLTLTNPYPSGVGTYVRLQAGPLKGFVKPNPPTVYVGTWYAEQVSASGLVSPTNLPAIDISTTDATNGWPYQTQGAGCAGTPGQYQTCFIANNFAFNSADIGQPVVVQYIAAAAQSGGSHTFQIAAADDLGDVGPCSNPTTVTMTNTPGPPDFDLSNFPVNGVLGSSQSAAVPWPTLQAGSTKWLLYKDNNIYAFSENVWLHNSNGATPVVQDAWADMGIAHLPSNSYPTHCPTQEQPQYTVRQVTAIGTNPSVVSLSGSPVSSAVTNGLVYFDDTAGIQAACNYAVPSGSDPVTNEVYFPPGYYMTTSNVTCGATASHRASGFHFLGAGRTVVNIDYEGGNQEADIFTFPGIYQGKVGDFYISGGPSGSILRFSTNNGTSSTSGINVENVQLAAGAHYYMMFGHAGDAGQISEVTGFNVVLLGTDIHQNAYRNWGGINVQGGNNLNYNFYNSGAGRLGSYTETSQVGNGSFIWSDSDYFGSTAGPGANINMVGGSISNSPRLGIHCTTCSFLHLGASGSYTLDNMRLELSTVLFTIPVTSATYQLNLIGNSILEPTATAAHYIITNQGSNMHINSVGNLWNTPLKFNINNASFRSEEDNYILGGSSGHSTLQDYFAQQLNISPKINVIQNNAVQGIHGAEVYDLITGGLAPTAIGSCGGALISGTDNAGTITISSGPITNCTIQFSHTRGSARPCVVMDGNATTSSTEIPSADTWTTTSFKFDFPSTSAYRFAYVCP